MEIYVLDLDLLSSEEIERLLMDPDEIPDGVYIRKGAYLVPARNAFEYTKTILEEGCRGILL